MSESTRSTVVDTTTQSWTTQTHRKSEYKFKDLSGERLGARIEELPPGGTSSYHHYHTSEEEHVLMLTGNGMLFLGTEEYPVKAGDHLVFLAGDERAHHIENTSSEACSYLVYGERNRDDVVIYPDAEIMLVKGLGGKQFTYRKVTSDEAT